MRAARSLRTFLAGTALLVLPELAAAAPEPAARPRDPDEYLVVDCLLPGRVRRLGRRVTYAGPRRPLRTTALDCGIRGGEYTAYDRADYRTALAVWQGEAKIGDAEAQYMVGQIYEKGLGTTPDYVRAAEWYRKAAEQNHKAAQISFGYLLERGLGIATDLPSAFAWYQRAAGLPQDLVVIAAAELEERARLERQLREQDREIEELRRRLSAAEEAARQAAATAESTTATDRQERQRLQALADTLRQELDARTRAAVSARAALRPPPVVTAALPGAGPSSVSGIDFGRYHALVIGNANYAALPDLPAAAQTARDLARLLESRYRFRVTLLLDADRAAILGALNAMREQLAKQDNLLIFYAGRSVRDPAGDSGWWQPVDADAESRVRWIPTEVLAEQLELMPARHALLIADAHFPGILTRSSIPPRLPGLSAEKRRQFLQTLVQQRSRLVLTPGEGVETAGPSAFSAALLEVLAKGTGVLEASTVYLRLNETLTGSRPGKAPEFAPMRRAGHEGGEFLLVAPER